MNTYIPNDEDRYYRPSREVHDQLREWKRENEKYAPPVDDGLVLAPDEVVYRPMSPQTQTRPMTPGSDKPYIPPEEPPRDRDRELSALPTDRASINIALPKRPLTPMNIHSPTPLAEPAETQPVHRRSSGITNGNAKRESGQNKTPGQAPVVHGRQRRKPVHRTREEEEAAYGRTFVGCGRKTDYDYLTKLGEGTFGYVLTVLAPIFLGEGAGRAVCV